MNHRMHNAIRITTRNQATQSSNKYLKAIKSEHMQHIKLTSILTVHKIREIRMIPTFRIRELCRCAVVTFDSE